MRFELKDDKSKQSPIVYVVRKSKNGHKIFLKYYVGFSLNKDNWNKSKQRVREINGIPYGSYNNTLKRIEDTVNNIFQNNSFYDIDSSLLREKIDSAIGRNKPVKIKDHEEETLFFKDADTLHLEEEQRTGIKGAKHLSNTIERLRDFNKKLEWNDITYRFYVDFINWTNTKQSWSKNYVGRHIKNIRKIVESGFKNGRIETPVHLTFKTMSEKVYNIYLSEEELTTLYEMKLPKAYERARDLFLIGCWTGMRVGNYLYIDSDKDIDLKKNTISAMINKGGGKVVLPLHWMIKEIIEKYNGFPVSISEQRLNRYIKEICEAAKFNEIVLSEKTIKGKKTKIYQKKWEMVSTHTARRSCVTNLFLRGVPVSTIMLITGHETEKQCKDYIKEFLHNEVPQEVMQLDFWKKSEKRGAKN